MSLELTYNSQDKIKYRTEVIEEYLLTQNIIIKKYFNKYKKYLNPLSDYYAVIVEPRSDHKLLECICRNVMYFLPEYWNLVIYSFDEEKVKKRLPDIEYLFFKTPKNSLNQIEYSNLLMSSDFWNNIPGENILIFQTDSYITRKFTDELIQEIKKYPFIGAPYKVDNLNNPSEINIIYPTLSDNYSMCGGFSYRNKKAMLNCIEKISLEQIKKYRIDNNLTVNLNMIEHEDVYFEHALYLLNYPLPNFNLSYLFCCQVHYKIENSFAIHGLYKNYVLGHLIFMLRPPLYELDNEITQIINK